MAEKPLGQKAYGSIPHLPGSRLGAGDHHVNEGQARICTERTRDRHDTVVVQEKLDGSCTAVALKGGQILALGRSGYLAQSSPYEQHQLFADWVRKREDRFRALLMEGERAVGEWLAQAHGTIYDLPHEPWVLFDIITGTVRIPFGALVASNGISGFQLPHVIRCQEAATSIKEVQEYVRQGSHHGASGGAEGAVWRVERKGKVDFLAKWVRPDKIDGLYMPEQNPNLDGPVWNWRPPHDA